MPVVLACPQSGCDGWLEYEEESPVGPVYRCNRCGHGTLARRLLGVTEAPVAPVQPDQPPKRTSRRANPEADLVQDIRSALEALGLRVLRVGQWRADRAGSDPGVPDLLISGSRTPLWWAVETKTKKGTLSPAQRELHEEGRTLVWRNVQDCLDWYAKEALR